MRGTRFIRIQTGLEQFTLLIYIEFHHLKSVYKRSILSIITWIEFIPLSCYIFAQYNTKVILQFYFNDRYISHKAK